MKTHGNDALCGWYARPVIGDELTRPFHGQVSSVLQKASGKSSSLKSGQVQEGTKKGHAKMPAIARVLLLFFVWMCLGDPALSHKGSCEDHSPRCVVWALRGACYYARGFMHENCPVSCNSCIDRGCYDRDVRCGTWARHGACVSAPLQYIELCPHSCDACVVPAHRQG